MKVKVFAVKRLVKLFDGMIEKGKALKPAKQGMLETSLQKSLNVIYAALTFVCLPLNVP